MTAENLPSIDYDHSIESSQLSVFAIWESGRRSVIPAPLSVRSSRYRQLIVRTMQHYQHTSSASILSIGAGNGFTEAELAKAGFSVVATDSNLNALEFCKKKGLQTARLNILHESTLTDFDLLYCDGVLGHLWSKSTGCAICWSNLARLGHTDAHLVISNDLADTDSRPDFGVASDSSARFFRPPADWFAQDALNSGFWIAEETRIVSYRRRTNRRRRELVILRRLLVHERKE